MREFGSEYDLSFRNCSLSDLWKGRKHTVLLRSGRDAIFAAAEKLLKEKSTTARAYVPALSCESMYSAFKNLGYEIVFYPIDEAFNPVYLDEIKKGDVLLLMLYYGMTDMKKIEKWIIEHPEVNTVLDITHSVWDDYAYGLSATFTIGSLRKSMGTVNGGLLVSDIYNVKAEKGENVFTEYRKKAFRIKKQYAYDRTQDVKNEYRKMLAIAEEDIAKNDVFFAADEESVREFDCVNVEEIRYRRKRNFLVLYNAINIKKLIPDNIDGTPFSLPVAIKNRDEIQREFAKRGVYAPVLWPIDETAKNVCGFAGYVADNMLSLPIDQRYGYDDMVDIASIVEEVLSR